MAAGDMSDEIAGDPRLRDIYERARSALEGAGSLDELERVRVAFLGRKGEISSLLQGIGSLPPDERRRIGRLATTSRTGWRSHWRRRGAGWRVS